MGAPPDPFSIDAVGSNFYIYSSDRPQQKEAAQLADLEKQIASLVAATMRYQIEFHVDNASTLGNFTASLQLLAPPGVTVTAAGASSVWLSWDDSVSCASIAQFREDAAKFERHTRPDTPVASVFYLDPAAAGDALGATAVPFAMAGTAVLSPSGTSPTTSLGGVSGGGTAGASGSGSGGTATSTGGASAGSTNSAAAPSSATGANGSTGGGSSSTAAAPAASAASATASPAASSAPTITITTTTTPPPPTQPGTSASKNSSPAPATVATTVSTAPPASTPTPAAPAPPATPPAATAPTGSVNGRDLLFSGGVVGDDAWITERKRALALLDLPQPQVLVNAWVMQSSVANPKYSGRMTNLLHQAVNSYNDVIQTSLGLGWQQLRSETDGAAFFDPDYYNYITLRTVADPHSPGGGSPDESLKFGICPVGQYCLGYQTLFRPAQPRLTDMLLTLLAANDPADATRRALEAIEDTATLAPNDLPAACKQDCPPTDELTERMRAELSLTGKEKWATCGCEQQDELYLLSRVSRAPSDMRLPLECFRRQMYMAVGRVTTTLSEPLAQNRDGKTDELANPSKTTSELGLVRAALADFLFNYKMSQQYPHEFGAYDLTASAQALDAAMAPFISAFNEDLQAFQSFVRAEFAVSLDATGVSKDKNTFLNGGIVTVQTTSGDIASVNTGTQSYLNVSKAPTIAQLVSSIAGAQPGESTNTLTGVLSNLSFNEAQVLTGALAAYQTTELNVGRQLNLVVKPRSLMGASAAEIDVQLNADQSPTAPNFFVPGATGAAASADLSTVTQHDVTTHVRIDSIRLFDISSFSAVLSKGRDKFPLLPPFVEIPYIGTLAGYPLKPAKEYHTSSAILSAVIVPTATDIAYSLRFTADRVVIRTRPPCDTQNGLCLGVSASDAGQSGIPCTWPPKDSISDSTCHVRKVTAMADLGSPIREFHREKLHCIATIGSAPYAVGAADVAIPVSTPCGNLTFANIISDDDN